MKIKLTTILISYCIILFQSNIYRFDFEQRFKDLKISKQLSIVEKLTMINSDDYSEITKKCMTEFNKYKIKTCSYKVSNLKNRIVIVEYVIKNSITAINFYKSAFNNVNKVFINNEKNLQNIYSKSDNKSSFIYVVRKGNHVYLFGYEGFIKPLNKSMKFNIQKNIQNNKSILIDDLVDEFEKMK